MIRYQIRLQEIVDEAKGTKTFYFAKPEDFTWEAGAHVHIAHVGYDAGDTPDKRLVRHLSIMTLPDENRIGITTRIPGSGSEFKTRLLALKPGDEVVLFKPGCRMALRRCGRPVVLLSMGVGIATMRPVIRSFLLDGSGIPELLSANVDSSGNFVFRGELDALATSTCQLHWMESRQVFYSLLGQLLERENAIWQVVGSDAFLVDVLARLKNAGVAEVDIVIDKKEEDRQRFFPDSPM